MFVKVFRQMWCISRDHQVHSIRRKTAETSEKLQTWKQKFQIFWKPVVNYDALSAITSHTEFDVQLH